MSDAQSPVSHVSEALTRVLSNIVPAGAYTLCYALLPGLFFEISILLANPARINELATKAEIGFGLGHGAAAGLALIIAFIIGNAFMFLVLLIQAFLGYLYRLRSFVWEELCTSLLFPIIIRFQGRRWWADRRTLSDLARYIQHVRMLHLGVDFDKGTRQCWALFAKKLLKSRYDIEAADLDQEQWNVLYWALGPLSLSDRRGSMTMIMFEATGWCGLSAILFAPVLRSGYFVIFCTLLILPGLSHDWNVAGSLTNPRFLACLKIRALLREYQKPLRHAEKRPTSASDTQAYSASESDEVC